MESSLRRCDLSKDLKAARASTEWISKGKAFQAARTTQSEGPEVRAYERTSESPG